MNLKYISSIAMMSALAGALSTAAVAHDGDAKQTVEHSADLRASNANLASAGRDLLSERAAPSTMAMGRSAPAASALGAAALNVPGRPEFGRVSSK